MECNYRKQLFRSDPATLALLTALEVHADELGLQVAIVYAGFPLYREDEEVVVAGALVISASHGVVLLTPFNTTAISELDDVAEAGVSAQRAFSLIFSRLVKSRALVKGLGNLRFPVSVALFTSDELSEKVELEDIEILEGAEALIDFFNEQRTAGLAEELVLEIASVVEGAKGLLKPRDRNLKGRASNSKAALVSALEAEIRRFDKDQKLGYLAPLNGPQRIRGLAGSGKTVVLAMKAALTHLREPDARIAYTFYTKSLYQHVKRLITRFYRQFDESDPDWEKLQVLHAWGGQTTPGLYYNACKTLGVRPMTYGEAASSSKAAFDFACKDLLGRQEIKPTYDYIFVDEGQDFAPSFMQLALKLAKNGRIVLAYDELQTIFQVDTPSVATIFGVDEYGEPLAQFEEDVVLHKCYRNPLEVLVCAHAIGLGLYGPQIVQLPEDEDHWEDLGYVVEQGPLQQGGAVVIRRPAENSPSSISTNVDRREIVIAKSFDDLPSEVDWISTQIINDVQKEGLLPEDVLVISADDLNSKVYFSAISSSLRKAGIEVNDLQSDSYGVRDFSEAGKVTFSTVYKAKGNEGFVVFIVGVDAVFARKAIRNRNIAFTAMTRAKGWLRMSGMGAPAAAFAREIEQALANSPRLRFTYPGPDELSVMRRDLRDDRVADVERSLDELEDALSAEEYENFLRKRLEEIAQVKKRRAKRTGAKSK